MTNLSLPAVLIISVIVGALTSILIGWVVPFSMRLLHNKRLDAKCRNIEAPEGYKFVLDHIQHSELDTIYIVGYLLNSSSSTDSKTKVIFFVNWPERLGYKLKIVEEPTEYLLYDYKIGLYVSGCDKPVS
jgi:hypothetical protein